MKTRAFRKPLSILLTLAMVFGMFAMLGAVAGAEISGSTLVGRYFSTDNVWYDAVAGANGVQWQYGDYPAYNANLGMTYFNSMYVRLENENLFENVTRDTGVTFAFNYRPNLYGDHRHILSIGKLAYSNNADNINNHFAISGATAWNSDGCIPMVLWVDSYGSQQLFAHPIGVDYVYGKEYNIVVSVSKDEGVVFYVDGVKKETQYKAPDSNNNDTLENALPRVQAFLDEVNTYTNNYVGCSRWHGDAFLEGYLSDLRIYKASSTDIEVSMLVTDMAGAAFDLTQPTFNATAYHYNDVATGGYANLAYTSGADTTLLTGNDNWVEIKGTNFKAFTPASVVMVNDGAHETYFPVQLETKRKNSTVWDNHIRHVCSNNGSFDLIQDWAQTLDGNYSNSWTRWAGTNSNFGPEYYSSQPWGETEKDDKNDTSRFAWNAIRFIGNANTDSYLDYFNYIEFEGKAYCTWTGANNNDKTGTGYFRTNENSNFYVLNYQPVYSVLNVAQSTYNNQMAGKAWMYTEDSYAQAMLAMRRLSLCNPNLYDYNGRGVGAGASLCAAAIKQAAADYAAVNLVKKTGTVTFNYEDNSLYQTVTADYGDTFTVPAVPAKASDAHYDYIDPVWTPSLTAGSTPVMSDDYKDQVYTASYTPSLRSYQITWNYTTAEGAQSTTTTVDYGQTPAAPAEATGNYQTAERVYTFSNWSPAVTAVTGAAAYTAQYTDAARTYEVKFYDLNGDQIGATQQIAYGAAATAPDLPTKAPDDDNHYTVTWDKAFNSITADTNVYAQAAGTAHSYSNAPTWSAWTESGDGWTVTPTFTCDNCTHTVSPAAAIVADTYEASCTENAATEYSAAVTMGGATYTCPNAKRIETSGTATGHTYVTPADTDWNWTKSGDTYTATVVVSCEKNDSTVTLTAVVSEPAIVDAQHLTPGSKTFTATATVGSQTFTATKTDEIPAEGHTWTYHDAVPSTVCTATGTVAYWSCSGCTELRAANQTDVITSTDDNTPGPHSYGELIPAVAPTCTEPGTIAYYECSVCHLKFDENKAAVDSIVDPATNDHHYNVLQYDETNHWFKCENCTATTDPVAHSGGTATCTALAECETCHQTYGNYNYNNHSTTETVLKNAVAAGYTHTGYTGDTYCKACDHQVGTGEEIAKLDINNNAIYAAAVEVAAEAEADPDKYDATAVAELNEKLDELTAALAVDDNEEAVTAALSQLETLVESMAGSILFTLTVDEDNGSDPVEKKGTHGSTVDLGTPEKEGYAFKEWTVTAGSVSGTVYTFTDQNATATAVYTVKTGDATTAAQAILDNPGAYDDAYVAALSGKIDELNALDATDPANNGAVKDVVDAINALLEEADANRVYTVTFTVDGETVKTEKVKTGNDATPPTVDEYVVEENIHGKFSGWTGDYTNVTADVDVSGTYAFTAHVWVDGEVTKAATCIAAGTQDQSCVCGATHVKTLAIDPTAHEYGEWTDEIPAGCTAEGTLGYYHCDVCGKNFDAAHNELDSLVIGKLEHTLHHVEAKAAGCPLHAARSMAPRKGQAVTVTGNDGNIEYWYCETCDFYYADADAATTLTEDEIVIRAAHNLTHHDGVEKTHTTDGAKEYWYCDICEMYFFTEDASEPLTEEQFSAQVVIPADTVHTPGTPVKKNEVKATCQAGGQYDLVTYCVEGGEELSRETVYTDPDPDAHTPGAAVKENETPATCTGAGSYDLVTYCTLCGDPVATETVTVPAKGHTWGDWTIVRPATEDDPGEAKRVCSACGEEETRSAEEVEPVDKIVKFVNIAKMYYVIDLGDDNTYTIYNSSTVCWYSNEPLTFYVGTFSGFGFSDVIVYANGQELAPDENGAYTLPNNGDTVIVTVSGAVQDDSAPNGKLSFWELLIRFFRKIVAFFSGAFGKAG